MTGCPMPATDAKLTAMSTTPRVLSSWRVPASGALAAGDYLTDGRRLFRVVSRFDPRAERAFAVLENCFTLDIDTYTPAQLASMPLRAVRHGVE
jgi:hypothetical protein